jgi:hypothetical protein
MSQVTIQGNAAGTGVFTIAAPNSNTNRSFTLPDESGTVLTDARLATQGEAQAGTDNTKLMTPLRVNEAIAALVTTLTVLNATAAATAGAIGTYAFAQTTGADVDLGVTVAGSTLQTCSALSRNLAETNTAGITASRTQATLTGTWRCMGTYDYDFTRTSGPTGGGATLWLRIS